MASVGVLTWFAYPYIATFFPFAGCFLKIFTKIRELRIIDALSYQKSFWDDSKHIFAEPKS